MNIENSFNTPLIASSRQDSYLASLPPYIPLEEEAAHLRCRSAGECLAARQSGFETESPNGCHCFPQFSARH